MIDINLLKKGTEKFNLSITGRQAEILDRYAEELTETNKFMNLTRVTDPEKILTDHFLDSFSALTVYSPQKGDRVLDIGTGAGFPGVPIAVLRPDIHVTMLDSTGKKINFVRDTCQKLGIKNVSFVIGRAEEEAHGKMRETFSRVYARAVSQMKILEEIALPFVRMGGYFIALKAQDCKEECDRAVNTAKNLGGIIKESHKIIIPFSETHRCLIVTEKISKTQKKYPRPYGDIAKK